MQQMYTPALEVSQFTTVRKLRELPLPGKVLVEKGATVRADSPVLSAELPGDIIIVRIADRMGFDADAVIVGMKVKVGDNVRKGQLLCELKTFFGLFTVRLESPIDGTVEFFTEVNAHLGIRQDSVPLTISAYVAGTIVETEEGKSVTIETKGSFFQGIFGVGGERQGKIYSLEVPVDSKVSAATIKSVASNLKNAIVIGGAQYDIAALKEAAQAGAVAVVTGSIDAETLAAFVGHEIGVSITGDEDVPLTLIISEGFGLLPLSQRIVDIAKSLQGKEASINGATQVRAGALRPEVIVPNSENLNKDGNEEPEARALGAGARVRMIRFPYFGIFGQILDMPHQPVKIDTGASVRVFKVKTDDGKEIVVPRANVELL